MSFDFTFVFPNVSPFQNGIIYCSIVKNFHGIAVFMQIVGNVWKISLCRKNVKFSRKLTTFGKFTGRIEPNLLMQVDFKVIQKNTRGFLNFLNIFYGALSKSNFLYFSLFCTKFQISDSHLMEKKENFKNSCISILSHFEINQCKRIWLDLIDNFYQHFSDLISLFLKVG